MALVLHVAGNLSLSVFGDGRLNLCTNADWSSPGVQSDPGLLRPASIHTQSHKGELEKCELKSVSYNGSIVTLFSCNAGDASFQCPQSVSSRASGRTRRERGEIHSSVAYQENKPCSVEVFIIVTLLIRSHISHFVSLTRSLCERQYDSTWSQHSVKYYVLWKIIRPHMYSACLGICVSQVVMFVCGMVMRLMMMRTTMTMTITLPLLKYHPDH